MVEQEKLQPQGLKTIREMQESMQKEDMQMTIKQVIL